ncbi:MAG TPA: PP2C family protein-serine/threonine phosphatase [Candidatus Ozemobacteraceae bacterium]|nr:PP2C family protein-serine/threonine phosphatase [Candidatus Ozemobacteraceae bacterium]
MAEPLSFQGLPDAILNDPASAAVLEYLFNLQADRTDGSIQKRLQATLVYRYAQAERELVRLNQELVAKQARIEADLKAAAGIQLALLPKPLPASVNVKAAWKFLPSEQVGGDIFMLKLLGERFIQVGILDISGHGVPSAMVTVSISQALQPHRGLVMRAGPDGTSEITPPVRILTELDGEYPYMRFKKTFSMIYGLLDRQEGTFTFSNGGHPYPIHVPRSGPPVYLEEHGAILGMGLGARFPESRVRLAPGDRLYFYTDGLTECRNPQKELFGEQRLLALSDEIRGMPLDTSVKKLFAEVETFCGGESFTDDFTFLGLEYVGNA